MPSTAVGISAAVRSGRLRPRAVVEEALGRITEQQRRLNCFEQVMADDALRRAETVDTDGPLAGVPVAVKAHLDVAGYVTTSGGRSRTTPAAEDCEVVRRLRAAGAVVVATTTMPELGQFPFTEGAAWGATRNPWALDRSTGGSSGGSAAAVASGCVPVAIGSDGGGSIRIPSSCCGLVGLKPARGRVSAAPHRQLWGSLGTIGPLTATVADSALVYDVLHGSTPSDRWSAPSPATTFAQAASAPARGLRVAWTTRAATGPIRVDPQVEGAVDRTAEQLRSAGHSVTRLDALPDPSPSFVPQFLAAIREECRAAEHPDRLERRSRTTAAMAAWVSAPVLRRALGAGAALRDRMRHAYAGYDVVLTPTIACLPPPLGRLDATGSARALQRSLPMVAFTALANVTGLPAMSVPAGLSREGLPIGVQLCSLSDELPLLWLAAELERLTPWSLPPG